MMRYLLFTYLLLFVGNIGFGQIRILSGTNLTIDTGTTLSINIPNINFVIDSGAYVINNGLISLGDSSDIFEIAKYPITGSGTEKTTRNLNTIITGINIGGLGIVFNNDFLPGITTIIRGHNAIYSTGTSFSVKRWFNLSSTSTIPANFPMTLIYDSTELYGNNPTSIKVLSTIDTTLSWRSLGGSSNPLLYNSTASIDSTGFFTMISTGINFVSINDSIFCINDSLIVDYSVNGVFNPENLFVLQLSDESGSFLSPVLQDTLVTDLIDFNEIFSTFLSPGSNYKIRVLSTSPAINSVDSTITLFSLPFISMTGLSDQYCSNEPVSLVGVSPIGGVYDVTFIINDTIDPSAAPIGVNHFSYSFTDVNGCSSIYIDSTEIILAPFVPVITISEDSLLSSFNSGNQWYYNGTLLLNDTNTFIIPTANGTYQVQTTGSNGCTSISDTFNFTTLNVPFSVNANYLINLFPNPASGNTLHFSMSGNLEIKNISIMSSLGQKVSTVNNKPGQSEIYIGNLESGSYLLNIESKLGVFSKRFVVIR
jgi:hypothetical protein